MRPASPEELARWDSLVAQNPNGGDVFQTKAFASIKASLGWRPQFIVYDLGNNRVATMFLTRKIPLLGELWYAPKGPGITNRSDFEKTINLNRQFAQNKNIFNFKLEPDVLKTEGFPANLHKVHNIQPNASTVIVNLAPSEDEILAGFRQRARRAIRQAQAAGVVVKAVEPNEQTYRRMYDLYMATGQRAGFHVRDFAYHQNLWQQWIDASQGQLFFAYAGDQPIAGAFVAYLSQKGLYKDGASDRDALKNGAAHLLQWEIMRWLKIHGITQYDLHGTPPAEELENTQHRFYGLGLFKTSFSDQLTEFVGTLDQPIKPASYKKWRQLGERAMQTAQYRLRGRTFY